MICIHGLPWWHFIIDIWWVVVLVAGSPSVAYKYYKYKTNKGSENEQSNYEADKCNE